MGIGICSCTKERSGGVEARGRCVTLCRTQGRIQLEGRRVTSSGDMALGANELRSLEPLRGIGGERPAGGLDLAVARATRAAPAIQSLHVHEVEIFSAQCVQSSQQGVENHFSEECFFFTVPHPTNDPSTILYGTALRDARGFKLHLVQGGLALALDAL